MSAAGHHLPRRRIAWAGIAAVALLLLVLLADAYAVYRLHLERLGNALDYYPFWAGGREVLQGHNPYDPAVTLHIQEAIYGRPALPDENQHGYAYPAYTPLVALPFLLLPFSLSAALWIASQQVLVVAAVILTVRAARWRIGRWQLVILCLAAMTFRYSMITLVLGQTSIWVLFCLALALRAGRSRRGVLTGLALAAGCIKPQLVVLPGLALLLTVPSGQRWRLVLAFGGAMAALLAGSLLLAGWWPTDYRAQLQAYQGYSSTQFPLVALAQTWLPHSAAEILNYLVIAVLMAVLAVVLWRWREKGEVTLPVALAVVVTQVAVPQTGSYNLATLLLPAVVALQQLSAPRLCRHRLAVAGKATLWADLVIVPWLLWPIVQFEGGISLDQVVVPALMLAVLLGLVIAAERNPGPAAESGG